MTIGYISTHAHRSVILLKRVLLENAEAVQRQVERSNQFDAALQNLAQQLTELSTMPESQRRLVDLIESLNVAVEASEERSRQMTTTTQVTETTTSTVNASFDDRHSVENVVVQTSSRTVTEQSVSRLKLEFSRFQKKACMPECECVCHLRRRSQTPKFMEKVVGQFLLDFPAYHSYLGRVRILAVFKSRRFLPQSPTIYPGG